MTAKRTSGVEGSSDAHCAQPLSRSTARRSSAALAKARVRENTSSYACSQAPAPGEKSPRAEIIRLASSEHGAQDERRCRMICCASSLEISLRKNRPNSSSETCQPVMIPPLATLLLRRSSYRKQCPSVSPQEKKSAGRCRRFQENREGSATTVRIHRAARVALHPWPVRRQSIGPAIRIHGARALSGQRNELEEGLPQGGHEATGGWASRLAVSGGECRRHEESQGESKNEPAEPYCTRHGEPPSERHRHRPTTGR